MDIDLLNTIGGAVGGFAGVAAIIVSVVGTRRSERRADQQAMQQREWESSQIKRQETLQRKLEQRQTHAELQVALDRLYFATVESSVAKRDLEAAGVNDAIPKENAVAMGSAARTVRSIRARVIDDSLVKLVDEYLQHDAVRSMLAFGSSGYDKYQQMTSEVKSRIDNRIRELSEDDVTHV